jgi:hypothetical protein
MVLGVLMVKASKSRHKPMTGADWFFLLAQAGSSPGDPSITVKELKKAHDRVGLKALSRLNWALNFAQENAQELSAGDALNRRIELWAFIHTEPLIWNAPESYTIPTTSYLWPDEQAYLLIHERFGQLLQSIARPGVTSFEIDAKVGIEAKEDEAGQVHVIIGKARGNAPNMALLKFAQLLAEHGSQLRRCKDEDCNRWFTGRPNKLYCSTVCTSRSTTRRSREK